MSLNKHKKENIEKILNELEKNGRISYTEISKNTKIHHNTVKKIMSDLLEEKIIMGYKPVINYKKLGKTHFLLLIKSNLLWTDAKLLQVPKKGKLLTESISKKNGCKLLNSGFLHGEYSIYLCFIAPNLITARNLSQEIMDTFDKTVSDFVLMEETLMTRKNGIRNSEFV